MIKIYNNIWMTIVNTGACGRSANMMLWSVLISFIWVKWLFVRCKVHADISWLDYGFIHLRCVSDACLIQSQAFMSEYFLPARSLISALFCSTALRRSSSILIISLSDTCTTRAAWTVDTSLTTEYTAAFTSSLRLDTGKTPFILSQSSMLFMQKVALAFN